MKVTIDPATMPADLAPSWADGIIRGELVADKAGKPRLSFSAGGRKHSKPITRALADHLRGTASSKPSKPSKPPTRSNPQTARKEGSMKTIKGPSLHFDPVMKGRPEEAFDFLSGQFDRMLDDAQAAGQATNNAGLVSDVMAMRKAIEKSDKQAQKDSEEYRAGYAMGEYMGPVMVIKGLTAADWVAMRPPHLSLTAEASPGEDKLGIMSPVEHIVNAGRPEGEELDLDGDGYTETLSDVLPGGQPIDDGASLTQQALEFAAKNPELVKAGVQAGAELLMSAGG